MLAICPQGHNREITWHNWISGRRCGDCTKAELSSIGSRRIRKFLEMNNVQYRTEYRFNDCKHKGTLPFDYAIFCNNKLTALIEYHGDQHFRYTPFYHSNAAVFGEQKIRDTIKTEYCINNGIPLLIIANTQDKKIETILENFIAKFFNLYTLGV